MCNRNFLKQLHCCCSDHVRNDIVLKCQLRRNTFTPATPTSSPPIYPWTPTCQARQTSPTSLRTQRTRTRTQRQPHTLCTINRSVKHKGCFDILNPNGHTHTRFRTSSQHIVLFLQPRVRNCTQFHYTRLHINVTFPPTTPPTPPLLVMYGEKNKP